ncbi:MAG: trypsin-like serine peptidase [Pseudobdellovibrionaceae bacterium]
MNSFFNRIKLYSSTSFILTAILATTACTNNTATTDVTSSTLTDSSTPGAIFLDSAGNDSRSPMTSTQRPWSTIGRITLDHGNHTVSICTGTMVGRHIMLTAAHCVLQNGKIHQVVFSAGYDDGKKIVSSKSKWITVGTTDPNSNYSADWAVVQLIDAIGDKVGWLGVQDISSGFSFPINVIYSGYSDNFKDNEIAGVDTNCYIREQFTNGTYGHDCSMGPGGSGGPLFATGDDGSKRVYCVNTRGHEGHVYSQYDNDNANICVMNADLLKTVKDYKQQYDTPSKVTTY